MPSRFGTALAASVALMTASVVTVAPAQAGDGRNAILGGLAAGAIAGGVIAGGVRPYAPPPPPVYLGRPAYYADEDDDLPPPRCTIERQRSFDRWGNFIGYRGVRVCD